MKQHYRDFNFRDSTLKLIATLNGIVEDYMRQGYVLTVRQLYYQMVARGLIPNTERSYKNITSVVNEARLAGLIDWSGIEDRTRSFIKRSRWTSGGEILQAVANQYHEDLWEGQDARVFVIVEKEALAGVLQGVCSEFDVPLLAARGYPSGTVLREFALVDLLPAIHELQTPVILHLGDHDPSGIDMTRDLEERLRMFGEHYGRKFELHRIALNMPQIEEKRPPENPAKVTDSRFLDYQRKHGDSSWELDALEPAYLDNLVREHVRENISDTGAWDERHERIESEKAKLLKIAEGWGNE